MALIKMVPLEEEFKRNPELNKSDLDMLKEWLVKQPHLPPMSDSELVLFLHSNYYRLEPTKTTIDTFFTVRTHVPEFLSNRDPLGSKGLRQLMNVVRFIVMPGTTPEGYRVAYTRIVDYEPSHYVFADALKYCCMTLELMLYTAGTLPGYIMVIDMEGAVFGHVARLNPMLMMKFLYYLQEALPIRLKGMIFTNTPSFMDLILNIMKPFMKKELLDMVFLYKSGETLVKCPIELLANEQGGKAGAIEDLWAIAKGQIEEHRAWFQEEETRKSNEAARPGKAKNVTDLFGVEGSFKKLDID